MHKQKSNVIDSISAKKQIDTNPLSDEPESWEQLSDTQLMEAWYSVDLDGHNGSDFAVPSLEELFQEANKGDVHAQYTLGKMYQRGVIVDVSYFNAALWFSRASSVGYPFAQYELAKMCQAGIGVEVDPRQAADLFEQSYDEFLELESKHSSRAVEVKLATICEKHLIHLTDSDTVVNWRKKAQKRIELIHQATKVPVQQIYQSVTDGAFNSADHEEPEDTLVDTNVTAKGSVTLTSEKTIVSEPTVHTLNDAPTQLLKQFPDKGDSDLCEMSDRDLDLDKNLPVQLKKEDSNLEETHECEKSSYGTLQGPLSQVKGDQCVRSQEDEYPEQSQPSQTILAPTETPEEALVSDDVQTDQSNIETPKPAETDSRDMDEFNLQEVIAQLVSINVHPGDSCAVLDGDKIVPGVIDRIEIYSNAVLVSVEIDELRRPYPVSEIDQTLFVGNGFIGKAEKAIRSDS